MGATSQKVGHHLPATVEDVHLWLRRHSIIVHPTLQRLHLCWDFHFSSLWLLFIETCYYLHTAKDWRLNRTSREEFSHFRPGIGCTLKSNQSCHVFQRTVVNGVPLGFSCFYRVIAALRSFSCCCGHLSTDWGITEELSRAAPFFPKQQCIKRIMLLFVIKIDHNMSLKYLQIYVNGQCGS